jgi:hypothetical protein
MINGTRHKRMCKSFLDNISSDGASPSHTSDVYHMFCTSMHKLDILMDNINIMIKLILAPIYAVETGDGCCSQT